MQNVKKILYAPNDGLNDHERVHKHDMAACLTIRAFIVMSKCYDKDMCVILLSVGVVIPTQHWTQQQELNPKKAHVKKTRTVQKSTKKNFTTSQHHHDFRTYAPRTILCGCLDISHFLFFIRINIVYMAGAEHRHEGQLFYVLHKKIRIHRTNVQSTLTLTLTLTLTTR